MISKVSFILFRLFLASAVISGVMSLAGQTQSASIRQDDSTGPDAPTFNKDIAPIIFASCAECHHPGGSAPFSLLSYQDVKKRDKQIAIVTASRYMPPWLPEPGPDKFIGERRLTDQQIALIKTWVDQGSIEGDPSELPAAPEYNEGWQLGKPDLVIKMPEAYTLAADGTDVFRNFVIPIPVTETRYVKALEILPGNKKIVHHANILIDRSQTLRSRDAKDPGVGFEGMDITIESDRFDPDSHFLFWKPGTPPYTEPEDMSWRVDKGTDLILNMHMQPSGKPETIQPAIGLYFADNPPTKFPMLLQLEHDGALDIPAGKKDFTVTDDFRLPVDVDVLGIYPHAHYLGKDIQGFATLPNGTKRPLIHIRDWDINWQAVYRYEKPIFLPKGTILSMKYTYDNSADNVRNPNHPPRRVTAGNKSTDEMAHLWIQVLPRTPTDSRIILQEALMRQRLRKYPRDFTAHFNLGAALETENKIEEAITEFREALRIDPASALAHNNLAAALQSKGRTEEAITEFRQALRISPGYANAHYNLGNLLLAKGEPDEAILHFRAVLQSQPDDADAYNDLGSALAIKGDMQEAEAQFKRSLQLNPDSANAHYNLARVFAIEGNLQQAATEFQQVLRIDPENTDAHNDLGELLAIEGNLTEAGPHFEQAIRSNPENADAHNNLGKLLALQGNYQQAAAHFEEALRINPEHPEAGENLKRVRALMGMKK